MGRIMKTHASNPDRAEQIIHHSKKKMSEARTSYRETLDMIEFEIVRWLFPRRAASSLLLTSIAQTARCGPSPFSDEILKNCAQGIRPPLSKYRYHQQHQQFLSQRLSTPSHLRPWSSTSTG